jgi:hypothetical protein
VEGVEVEVEVKLEVGVMLGLIFVEEGLEVGRMALTLRVVEVLVQQAVLIHELYMVYFELTNWDQTSI